MTKPDFDWNAAIEKAAQTDDLLKRKRQRVKSNTPVIEGLTEAEVRKVVVSLMQDDMNNRFLALADQINDRAKSVILKMQADFSELEKEVRGDRKLELVTPDQDVIGEVNGLKHYQLDDLIRFANTRDRYGNRINLLLKGPAGSGKSTGCKQLAEAFDLPFGYIGQTEMPHDVIGSVNPMTDTFRGTSFTDIYEHGGVIVFEEMDAWSPRATLVINVPLANGYLRLPSGRTVERHPDCIVIACANTWGTGATSEYVGRNKLDAAFLDRFGVKMMWGYDYDLERRAANNDVVVDAVQQARRNAEARGLHIMITPRSSIDISNMVRCGVPMRDAFDANFLAGLDKEQRRTIMEDVILD